MMSQQGAHPAPTTGGGGVHWEVGDISWLYGCQLQRV